MIFLVSVLECIIYLALILAKLHRHYDIIIGLSAHVRLLLTVPLKATTITAGHDS